MGSYMQRAGVLIRIILKRTPKRDQDPVLRVWLEFLFTVRGANSRTEHYLLSCCFPLNTPKGTARAHTVDLMWLNVLRGTTYLTPKRCDQQPCHVYMEAPPPPPGHSMIVILLMKKYSMFFNLWLLSPLLMFFLYSILWTLRKI